MIVVDNLFSFPFYNILDIIHVRSVIIKIDFGVSGAGPCCGTKNASLF